MKTLSSMAPDFAEELICALEAQGRNVLAAHVAVVKVQSCTFDRSADASYIYFARPAQSKQSKEPAAPVAETIPFAEPHWFNIDVDHHGYLFGVELLGRADIVARLQSALTLGSS